MSEPRYTIQCPLCGTDYDPSEHTGCAACPLNRGCQLTCCPQCGYETVDPNRSILARLAKRLVSSKKLVRTT